MTPSKFQTAIFSALRDTDDNIAIQAVAGSGKSTTLEHSVGYLSDESAAMFAFNRDIVESLKLRMERQRKKPRNLTISTINAFGWQICRASTNVRQISKFKDDDILQRYLNINDAKEKNEFYRWRGLIGRIVALLKANCVFKDVLEPEVQRIADEYGLDLPTDPKFMELALSVWSVSHRDSKSLNFSDQIYMPLANNWDVPRFSVGMVDELQDLNPAQQQLMLLACKRFIGVGDKHQAIYAFAGADAKSMQTMIQETRAKELPLSVCYRCPESVVLEAKKIVPQIESYDGAPKGVVDTMKLEQMRASAVADDFVLCRTTAPLVSECFRMIREGKRAMVKGRDIGDQLVYLIDKLGVGRFDSSRSLYEAVCNYHTEETERLSRANRDELITVLDDRVETLKILVEAAPTVAGVISRIESIFSDKVSGVVFSTIHKSKGLEAERVFILKPELLPHPNAKTDIALDQEMNLKYVAITRAKKALYYV